MTTTLNLPDDLASAVQRRAAEEGRDLATEVVELVRKGLAVTEVVLDNSRLAPPMIVTDSASGLPFIRSAPDAPITRMAAEQIQSMIDQIEEQEDLERAGIPPRP